MRLLFLLFLMAAAASGLAQAPVTNVHVTLDPPDAGRQVVTLNLTPTATFTAGDLEAVCQYRQEFNWPPRSTNPVRRVITPAIFTYRTKAVRFVNGLDLHLSFFVPVDVRELREKHGPTTFVTNAPVTISSVTFTACENDKPLWSFQAVPVTNANDGVLR